MKQTSSPKVFVVILNYNGIETLNNCLSSVFQSDYDNFEVVVVDNDSRDGSFEKARKFFSRAHFIKNSANVGFAQGNNVGIRFALEKFADAVFVLNNDTIIERSTISSLASEASNKPGAGILCPIILNPSKESIWFAGGLINWKKMRTIHIHECNSLDSYSSEYLSGCAMFIKKEVFKKIGLFDERYFLYYEDADFSYRTKKIGFDLLMVPAASIIHLEQSNTKNSSKIYWLVLSGLLFFFSHSTFTQKLWLYPYFIARKLKNFYNLAFNSSEVASNIRKAFKDYPATKRLG